MGVGLSLLFWKIQNNLLQEECVMFFNHVALLPGHLRWAHHRCCCRWHPRTRTESFSWGESHLRGSSCHYHDWGNWRWAGWRGERCLFLEAPSLRSSRGDVRCRWDFPILLQCVKVKNESEVAQSCPTLHDPMDRSLPGSSIHGIFQARVLEWGAIA